MKVIGWVLAVWGFLAAFSFVLRATEIQQEGGSFGLIVSSLLAAGIGAGGVTLIRRANAARSSSEHETHTIPPMPTTALEPDEYSPPTHDGSTAGRRPRRVTTRGWRVFVLIATPVTLVVSLSAGMFLRDRASDAALRLPPPDQEEHVVEPASEESAPLKASGSLFILSPTAHIERTWNGVDYYYKDCRGADRSETERLVLEGARLSFSSGDEGTDLISAAEMTGRARLVPGGRGICGWKINFWTQLPANTETFSIQYGTTHYWGPYSKLEATGIRLVLNI